MTGLSERDAFEALALFLNQYYEPAGDDMVTLMADITIESDGGTLDPAAWDDWLRCVREVERRRETARSRPSRTNLCRHVYASAAVSSR